MRKTPEGEWVLTAPEMHSVRLLLAEMSRMIREGSATIYPDHAIESFLKEVQAAEKKPASAKTIEAIKEAVKKADVFKDKIRPKKSPKLIG